MKSNIVLALLLSSFSTTAIGQNPTPVIDLSSPILSSPPIENNVTRTADVTAAGDSYYQSQILQEEVRMLRGPSASKCSHMILHLIISLLPSIFATFSICLTYYKCTRHFQKLVHI